MERNLNGSTLGLAVVLGSIWGMGECVLGAALHRCAAAISGSLMTGVALFFIAAAWRLTRRAISVAVVVLVACLLKMFDVLILATPLRSGTVANPLFAIFLEGAAFLALAAMIRVQLSRKAPGQALLGGMAALLAVNLFPLTRIVTGIPACVVPGTGFPMSLYYAPLAVGLALLTVPLGFLAGEKLLASGLANLARGRFAGYLAPSLSLLVCLLLIAVAG